MRKLFLIAAPLLGSALLGAEFGPASATVAGLAHPAAASATHGLQATPVGYDEWEDDYDDDDDYVVIAPPFPPPAAYAPPPVVVGAPPYVYGWPPPPPPRPASCGQYRYWNGEFCADARFRPPYIGPRW